MLEALGPVGGKSHENSRVLINVVQSVKFRTSQNFLLVGSQPDKSVNRIVDVHTLLHLNTSRIFLNKNAAPLCGRLLFFRGELIYYAVGKCLEA